MKTLSIIIGSLLLLFGFAVQDLYGQTIYGETPIYHLTKARELVECNQLDSALYYYESATYGFADESKKTLYVVSKFELGLVYMQLKKEDFAKGNEAYIFKYRDAARHFKEAIDQGSKQYFAANPEIKSRLHTYLGVCQFENNNYNKAEKNLRIGLGLAQRHFIDTSLITADAHQAIARYYSRTQQYDKSVEHFTAVLDITTQVLGANDIQIGQLYSLLSFAKQKQNNNQEALEFARKSLDIFLEDQNENHPSILHIYNLIASCYNKVGMAGEAQIYEWKGEMYRIKKRNPEQLHHPDVNILQKNIAQKYYELEQCDKASAHYQKYLNRLSDPELEDYHFLNQIGNCFVNSSDQEAALKTFNKSLCFADENPDRRMIFKAESHFALAQSYHALQEADLAYLHYKQALNTLISLPKNDSIETGKAWGEHHIKHKDYEGALRYFNKLVQQMKRKKKTEGNDIAIVKTKIANTYLLMEEFDLAHQSNQEAYALVVEGFDPYGSVPFPTIQELPATMDMLEALFQRGKIYYAAYLSKGKKHKGDLVNAHTAFSYTTKLIDKMREEVISETFQQDLSNRAMDIYETSIEVAFALYQINQNPVYLESAYTFAEKSKAFLLKQAIINRELRTQFNISSDVSTYDKCLGFKVDYYKLRLALTKKQWKHKEYDYLDYLVKYKHAKLEHEEFRQRYATVTNEQYQTATVKELQANAITDESALIAYFSGQKHLYIFALSNRRTEMFQVVQSDVLQNNLKAYRDQVAAFNTQSIKKPFNTFTKVGHQLYQQLLADPLDVLQSLDRSINKLIIIPDGDLHYFSFETFLTEEVPSIESALDADYTILPYLIKTHTVNYAFSGSLLLKKELDRRNQAALAHVANQQRSTKCLFFAPFTTPKDHSMALNGDFNTLRNKHFDNLPYSQRELRALASHLNGDYYIGKKATEEHFKLKTQQQNYKVIHLSTHGSIESNDLFSHLLFHKTKANRKTEDNQLHIYELYNLDVKANLVVLSACSTGLGNYVPGEGLQSLGRAFMYAGSESLVMSLWEVNDKTTSKLMTNYYEALAAGVDKDVALQTAKLQYLQQAPEMVTHPAYWAAFIPVGDDRAIL